MVMDAHLTGHGHQIRAQATILRNDLRVKHAERRHKRGMRTLGQYQRHLHDVDARRGEFDVFDSVTRPVHPEYEREYQQAKERNRQIKLQSSGEDNRRRGVAVGGVEHFSPQSPFTFPKPFAPLTVDHDGEDWTQPVLNQFRNLASYCERLAASFLSTSQTYKFWAVLTTVIIVISQCGIISAVLILPDAEDWYGGLIASIALAFLLIDQTMQFGRQADRYSQAAQQFRTLANNTYNYLLKPFDKRADPYDLSVGVENRLNDIIDMANGRQISVASDSFTRNPYD
jgi:hypothetical protein